MLFDLQLPEDNSPVDNTNITTTLLYFSEDELKEFKKLCKAGIIAEYGEERFEKGNLSDFLLLILNRLYAKNNS